MEETVGIKITRAFPLGLQYPVSKNTSYRYITHIKWHNYKGNHCEITYDKKLLEISRKIDYIDYVTSTNKNIDASQLGIDLCWINLLKTHNTLSQNEFNTSNLLNIII